MNEDVEHAIRSFLEEADTARILKGDTVAYERQCVKMVVEYEDLFRNLILNLNGPIR